MIEAKQTTEQCEMTLKGDPLIVQAELMCLARGCFENIYKIVLKNEKAYMNTPEKHIKEMMYMIYEDVVSGGKDGKKEDNK